MDLRRRMEESSRARRALLRRTPERLYALPGCGERPASQSRGTGRVHVGQLRSLHHKQRSSKMNTVGNSSTGNTSTATTATTAGGPANPAKGNQRGQTTLAAEIDRWQALANNMAPQIEQMPGLKEPFAQFQTLLAQAIAVRNQLNTLKADTATALTQRDQLLVDGAAFFSRLRLGLQSAHGPESP